MTVQHDPLAAYAQFFESLSRDSLPGLGALVSEDVHFRDPFNDVRGRDALIRIFEHMFETTTNPRFRVVRIARDDSGGILEWVFDFAVKGRALTIRGTSVITLDKNGLVASHIDHWDASRELYAKLPLIGPVVRWLGRKFAV